jgi:hypothetical protein
MTGLQEAICDRLVEAHISGGWADGPLHIAARVIDPKFQLVGSRYGGRAGQLVRTLNWPRLFCFALHGANAALKDEEKRRSLAITIFGQVAPRPKRKHIAVLQTSQLAASLAVRVHPLACPDPCPLHQAMVALANDLQAGRKPTRATLKACAGRLTSCPSYRGSTRAAVSTASPPAHAAVVAYRFLLIALGGSMVSIAHGDSARESARTETKVRGLQGAVEICLEAARKLGL